MITQELAKNGMRVFSGCLVPLNATLFALTMLVWSAPKQQTPVDASVQNDFTRAVQSAAMTIILADCLSLLYFALT